MNIWKYSHLIDKIESPNHPWDRFSALRELYNSHDPCEGYPYLIDWQKVFTPIEYQVWQDIRYLGIRMYPQYPIGRFFLDFADPKRKIGIECDGKHHNHKNDKVRDSELHDIGWNIYRLSGKDCFNYEKPSFLLSKLYGIKIRFEEEEEFAE